MLFSPVRWYALLRLPTVPLQLFASPASEAEDQPTFLRNTKRWGCISSCGACCYLDPTERVDLDDWLAPDERDLYQSMVGTDGFCSCSVDD